VRSKRDSDQLAKARFISDDRARSRRVTAHQAGRVDRTGVLGGVGDKDRQVDRLAFERATLVKPGQQQQVVYQAGHPGGLTVDAAHGRVEICRSIGQSMLEQLRVASDRGERGPQLVRGVRHETTQPRLGRLALAKRRFDTAQHEVEGAPEPANLCAVVRLLHAPAQVAGCDVASGIGHLLEREQA
jgi:hypothetical protein